MSNIGSSLFFNAIFEIDSFIQATLKKSMETFHEFTLQDQALPYNFYSVITNSLQLTDEQLELKMKFNPIQLDGRIRLIDGCLNSQFVGEKFQRLPLTIYSVHTLRNCFVNISHADSLIMYFTDKEEEFKANIFIKKEVTAFKKVKKFIEGSHNLFEVSWCHLGLIFLPLSLLCFPASPPGKPSPFSCSISVLVCGLPARIRRMTNSPEKKSTKSIVTVYHAQLLSRTTQISRKY